MENVYLFNENMYIWPTILINRNTLKCSLPILVTLLLLFTLGHLFLVLSTSSMAPD